MSPQQIFRSRCVDTQNEVVLNWQKPARRASLYCPIEIGLRIFRKRHSIVEFGGPPCESYVSDNGGLRGKRRDTQLILIFAVDQMEIHPRREFSRVQTVREYLRKFAARGSVAI